MPYLNVGEVRIHHHTYGEGEPLVLIPGLCGDLYNWKKMVPLIKDHCRRPDGLPWLRPHGSTGQAVHHVPSWPMMSQAS